MNSITRRERPKKNLVSYFVRARIAISGHIKCVHVQKTVSKIMKNKEQKKDPNYVQPYSCSGDRLNTRKHLSRKSKTKAIRGLRKTLEMEQEKDVGAGDERGKGESVVHYWKQGEQQVGCEKSGPSYENFRGYEAEIESREDSPVGNPNLKHWDGRPPPQLSPIKCGVNSLTNLRTHPPLLSPAVSPNKDAFTFGKTQLGLSKSPSKTCIEREIPKDISTIPSKSPYKGSGIIISGSQEVEKVAIDKHSNSNSAQILCKNVNSKISDKQSEKLIERTRNDFEPYVKLYKPDPEISKTLAVINAKLKMSREGLSKAGSENERTESHLRLGNEPENQCDLDSMSRNMTDLSESKVENLILTSKHPTTSANEAVIGASVGNCVNESEMGENSEANISQLEENESIGVENQSVSLNPNELEGTKTSITEGENDTDVFEDNSRSMQQIASNGPVLVAPNFDSEEETNSSQVSPAGELVNYYVEKMLSSEELQDFEKDKQSKIEIPNEDENEAFSRTDDNEKCSNEEILKSESPELIDLVSDSEVEEKGSDDNDDYPRSAEESVEKNEEVGTEEGSEGNNAIKEESVGSAELCVVSPASGTNDSFTTNISSVITNRIKDVNRQWAATAKVRHQCRKKLAMSPPSYKPRGRRQRKEVPKISRFFSMLLIQRYKKENRKWEMRFGKKSEVSPWESGNLSPSKVSVDNGNPASISSIHVGDPSESAAAPTILLEHEESKLSSTSASSPFDEKKDRPSSPSGESVDVERERNNNNAVDSSVKGDKAVDVSSTIRLVRGTPAELFKKRRAELMKRLESSGVNDANATTKVIQNSPPKSLPVNPDDCIKEILKDLKYVKKDQQPKTPLKDKILVLHYDDKSDSRSVENSTCQSTLMMKSLCRCQICNQEYNVPRLASECLRSHGWKQCWLCDLSSRLLPTKGMRMPFLQHNSFSHPDMKCQLCGETLPSSIKLRQHFESVHFHLQEDQCSGNDIDATKRRKLRLNNGSHARVEMPCHKSPTANSISRDQCCQTSESPNAEELRTTPKAVYVSVIVSPKKQQDSGAKDQTNSQALAESATCNPSFSGGTTVIYLDALPDCNGQMQSSTTAPRMFPRPDQNQTVNELAYLTAAWAPCFTLPNQGLPRYVRPPPPSYPGQSFHQQQPRNPCPASVPNVAPQGSSRPAFPQTMTASSYYESQFNMAPGQCQAYYPGGTCQSEGARARPQEPQVNREFPSQTIHHQGYLSPKEELAGILYQYQLRSCKGTGNVLNFNVISCAVKEWYNNLSPVDKWDFEGLYKNKMMTMKTFKFLKHCRDSSIPQFLMEMCLNNNSQAWECIYCLKAWFRELQDRWKNSMGSRSSYQ